MWNYEVVVHRDGTTREPIRFDTLEEAECYAERVTEWIPGARCVIESRMRDHTAWEDVALDTALDEDYVRDVETA